MTFKQRMQRFGYRYQRFVEKQGFPIIMTVCVAVVVLSAVWSGRMDQTIPMPTPPVSKAQSAAGLQQESLRDVSTPTPAPTPAPAQWLSPLENVIVLRTFNASRMEQSALSGLWQVHAALDMQADYGEPVFAMASGTVTDCTDEGLLGVSVTIDHGDGISACYANLAQTASLHVGDPVEAGQTLGFAGSSIADEAGLPTHVHLFVLKDGRAIDPLKLFRP